MKKAILASIVLASTLAGANASIILSDTFSYPDGDLTAVSGGLWVAHIGAGGNPIKASNGQADFQEITAAAEDLHMDLPQTYGTNSRFTLYSSYKLTAPALPGL